MIARAEGQRRLADTLSESAVGLGNLTLAASLIALTDVQTPTTKADTWRRYTPGGQLALGLAGDAQVNLNVNLAAAAGKQVLIDAGTAGAPGLAFAGDPDTGISRNAANILQISSGGSAYAVFSTGQLNYGGNVVINGGGFLYLFEAGSAPAATADYAVFWAQDSGSGKTVARVKVGAVGTTAVLATEA